MCDSLADPAADLQVALASVALAIAESPEVSVQKNAAAILAMRGIVRGEE